MRRLEVIQMENVNGGSGWDCAGAALGIVGLVATVVTAPVTGGISAWVYAGAIAGGFSTGFSLGGCFSY